MCSSNRGSSNALYELPLLNSMLALMNQYRLASSLGSSQLSNSISPLQPPEAPQLLNRDRAINTASRQALAGTD